jgi:hypothetical protein
MAKELMEIGGFITEGAEIVNHDNSLSGNGTVDSPLGVNSDFIVVTEETIGTYTVPTSGNVGFSKTFVKAGYKPIAFVVKFSYAGMINFNNELTEYKPDNSLYVQGYAHSLGGKDYAGITFKAIITWVKV